MQNPSSFRLILIIYIFLSWLLLPVFGEYRAETSSVVTTDESARCLNCHYPRQKKLVENWEKSKHAKEEVGCYECHRSTYNDPASKRGHFGFNVQLPVSPLRCAECHEKQYQSFASSSHAMAYETIRNSKIASESEVLFETSCTLCHGNELKMENGRFAAYKWPNHGIGRINTDGSRGNCVACHSHHEYSLELARSPETCGRCHHGLTGPAYEAWNKSKHGSNWKTAAKNIDFNQTLLIPAQHDIDYPDCFVCHIAATEKKETPSTHNPGERLSWKLAGEHSVFREDWGEKRLAMQNVCSSCHGNSQIDQFYRRYDAAVIEINKKTKEAGQKIGNDLMKRNAIKAGAISAKIGAAMMGPLQIRDGLIKIERESREKD
jgi:hypothetical protein